MDDSKLPPDLQYLSILEFRNFLNPNYREIPVRGINCKLSVTQDLLEIRYTVIMITILN